MNVLKLKCKTVWQGKVGIREKYIIKALQEKFDIQIIYSGEVMSISNERIKEKIVGRSDKPFYDRFKGLEHYLIYFDWKPDEKPATLFDLLTNQN